MCLPFKHNWTILEKCEVKVYSESALHMPVSGAKLFILQCLRCGWMRSRRFNYTKTP